MVKYDDVLEFWKDRDISNESDLRTLLDNFKIVFAYNSNKIENEDTSYHNTREIFENGKVINYTGDLRTLFEIQNQKECYEFLISKMISKEPITKDLILEVHRILCKGCYDETRFSKGERPGTFKVNDYGVGDDIGAAPEEVEGEIINLCEELKLNSNGNPLVVASYFHLTFESIHPFADGNGRVGRTLMNYYLITHNYPPTIIYDEDKKTYYMALAVFDKSDEIKGFIQFIKEETIKTWSNRITRNNITTVSGNPAAERESVKSKIDKLLNDTSISDSALTGSDNGLDADINN